MINIRNIPLTGTYEDIVRLRDAYQELATDLSMALAALGIDDTDTTEKLTELTAVTVTRLTADKIITEDLEADAAAVGELTADAANITTANTENIVLADGSKIYFEADDNDNEEIHIDSTRVYIDAGRIYLNTSNLFINGTRYVSD